MIGCGGSEEIELVLDSTVRLLVVVFVRKVELRLATAVTGLIELVR